MFALLCLLPRWLVLGALTFLFGFCFGQVTAYRRLALEASVTRQERLHKATAHSGAASLTPRVASAQVR